MAVAEGATSNGAGRVQAAAQAEHMEAQGNHMHGALEQLQQERDAAAQQRDAAARERDAALQHSEEMLADLRALLAKNQVCGRPVLLCVTSLRTACCCCMRACFRGAPWRARTECA